MVNVGFAMRVPIVRTREMLRVAKMGHLDDRLRNMLAKNGIKFDEHGHMLNPAEWHAVMDDVSFEESLDNIKKMLRRTPSGIEMTARRSGANTEFLRPPPPSTELVRMMSESAHAENPMTPHSEVL